MEESLQVVEENLEKIKAGQFDPRLVDAFKASQIPNQLARLQAPGWISHELNNRFGVQMGQYRSTGLQRLKHTLSLEAKEVIDFANTYLGENRLTVLIK